MRKSIAGLLFVIAAVCTTSAHAITGNYVKDFEHPFVGLVVFYDAAGQFIWQCSGSLISPTKLVTAGHCADTACLRRDRLKQCCVHPDAASFLICSVQHIDIGNPYACDPPATRIG